MPQSNKIPKRYQPKNFNILYDDRDIIIGDKAAGVLTVAAAWNKNDTVHSALNQYVRKGNSKSKKCVYVVHRLDQNTSGILIFAKTEQVQRFLKDDWKNTIKTYYAVVHGQMAKKGGTISSYLIEDEEYMVHSTKDRTEGKLSHTEYVVIGETSKFSLLKINLLTGRKNQIRVHLANEGHPVVGDSKYGKNASRQKRLALHSQSISFTHPFSKERMTFETNVPEYFTTFVGHWQKKPIQPNSS
ncbi:MAG: RNA pseudouridine synthase [Candidatus Omnitrophica bacterium]|nr:RNA pseudouridine synthase [Candidatus Omnitrophota bacterium]